MPDQPIITIDSREQLPLVFPTLPTARGTLVSGDYSVAGLENLFSVERKSVPDLIGCCVGENRARFERELARLRGYRFARLVIIGEGEHPRFTIGRHGYRSNILPQSVLGSLAAWEARYLPICYFPDPQTAATSIETWAKYFAREICQEADAFRKAVKHLPATGCEPHSQGRAVGAARSTPAPTHQVANV